MKIKHYAILGHILFWALDFLRCYQYSTEFPLQETVVWISFNIVFFYLNYFVLIPLLFRPDNVFRFFIWGIAFLSLFTLGYYGLTFVSYFVLKENELDYANWLQQKDNAIRVVGWSAHIIAYYGAVSTMSRLFYDRYHNIQEANALIEQKTSTQISTIRANINTPFFVDMLKEIKAKATKNPESVSDRILQLSSVLRHSLYETSKKSIPVNREIETANQYIKLINDTTNTISLSYGNSSLECPPNFIIRGIHHWLEIKSSLTEIHISIHSNNKATTILFPESLQPKELTEFTDLLNPSSFTFFEISIDDKTVVIK